MNIEAIAAAHAVIDLLGRNCTVPTDLLAVLAPAVGDSARWFAGQTETGYRCCSERQRIQAIERLRLLIVRLESDPEAIH